MFLHKVLNLWHSNYTWLLWKTTPHPTHDGNFSTTLLETNLYQPVYGWNCQAVDGDSVTVDNLYCQKNCEVVRDQRLESEV